MKKKCNDLSTKEKRCIVAFLTVLFYVLLYIYYFPYKQKPVLFFWLIVAVCVFLIYTADYFFYFNEDKDFNRDSIYICSQGLIIILLLFIVFAILVVNTCFKAPLTKTQLCIVKKMAEFTTGITFTISLIFWVIYFCRCKKVIKKDVPLFRIKMLWSLIESLLLGGAAYIFIMLFSKKDSVIQLEYKSVNILINAISPFISLYTYSREEIDKFESDSKKTQKEIKQGQESQKTIRSEQRDKTLIKNNVKIEKLEYKSTHCDCK